MGLPDFVKDFSSPLPSSLSRHRFKPAKTPAPIGVSPDNHPVVIDAERVGGWRSREIDDCKFTIPKQVTMLFIKGWTAFLNRVD